MYTNKKTARIVGVLFIIASAAPISTIFFLGFLGGAVSGEPTPTRARRARDGFCGMAYN
jgi:hypothetical protein